MVCWPVLAAACGASVARSCATRRHRRAWSGSAASQISRCRVMLVRSLAPSLARNASKSTRWASAAAAGRPPLPDLPPLAPRAAAGDLTAGGCGERRDGPRVAAGVPRAALPLEVALPDASLALERFTAEGLTRLVVLLMFGRPCRGP